MFKKISLILVLSLFFAMGEAFCAPVSTGPWRFELKTSFGTVPFIIKFKRVKKRLVGTLQNGKESIRLTGIIETEKEVTIPLQNYEKKLVLTKHTDERMNGWLVQENKNPIVKIPVQAIFNIKKRFPQELSKPTINLTGRWEVVLVDADDKKEPGIIIFNQNKNYLTGSILTTTGDFRYMEGFVSGDSFEAASFDGGYNYLIQGNVKNKELEAQILAQYKMTITGKFNPKATLPDAYSQTKLEKDLNFSFPDLSGRIISLKNDRYKNKPIILTFFGTWCPNCLDEMNYLIPWYKKNRERGIEIIALAFERSLSPEAARIQLRKTQKQKNIPYTLLHAGSTSEDKPVDKIPGLKNFISFPTTVFLNKNHKVVKVHAGFTGPSTGVFFDTWVKDFENNVDELLK